MPTTSGAAPDFFVEPLLGVVGPDLTPDLLGEGGKRQQVAAGRIQVFGHLGQLIGQCVEYSIILGYN
jgi:hypothetical protein